MKLARKKRKSRSSMYYSGKVLRAMDGARNHLVYWVEPWMAAIRPDTVTTARCLSLWILGQDLLLCFNIVGFVVLSIIQATVLVCIGHTMWKITAASQASWREDRPAWIDTRLF